MQAASCRSRHLSRSQTASLRVLQAKSGNRRQAQTSEVLGLPESIAHYIVCQILDSSCAAIVSKPSSAHTAKDRISSQEFPL